MFAFKMAVFYCLKYTSAFFPTILIDELKTVGGCLFSAQYFRVAESKLLTTLLRADLCLQLFSSGWGRAELGGEERRPLGVCPCWSSSSCEQCGPDPPQRYALASCQHTHTPLWSLAIDLGLFFITNRSPMQVFAMDFDISINYKT